jgi:hypothetical protein
MLENIKPSGKWMKEFDKRMRAARDLARGIPESHITEIEAAARQAERALLSGNEAFRKAAEVQLRLQKAANAENEKLARKSIFPRPLATDIAKQLAGRFQVKCDCACCVRDFELLFAHGVADAVFQTQTSVTTVQHGLVGWSDFAPPQPHIANTGSSDGQWINGNLDLYWTTSVPHDGIFAFSPASSIWGERRLLVQGSHRVWGTGWPWSSNDARVEVEAWVIVYLDGEWLDARQYPVSSDATHSQYRTKYFGEWLDLPGRIVFQARAGQELGMIVRLYCGTWANDEGDADIWVSAFGLPSNMISDMDLIVTD